jgi:hypothetical protein
MLVIPVAEGQRPQGLVVSDAKAEPASILAFLTWSWVVEVLAGAVLGWLAKLALDSLFKGPEGSGGIAAEQFYELLQKTMWVALSEFDVNLLNL